MKSMINTNIKTKGMMMDFVKVFSIIWMTIMMCTIDLQATHIVGGDITYQHISGDTYRIRLTLRRDCFLGSPEAEFDDPASIGIFTSSGELAKWLVPDGQLLIPYMDSDTLNQFIRSDCGFEGAQVCVHETIYEGIIDLPFRRGGYVLAYQRCCRNSSLQNIVDPLRTGTTYSVILTEDALRLRNNSPRFVNWPDVYICANKPLDFDHSAIDVDGDSLVYRLCVPNSGGTFVNPKPQPPASPPYDPIQWRAPYSIDNLMGGVPLTIDRQTGQITANPNTVGQFLVGVCVDEYRNGVLISRVQRDFQYNVRVCSQPPLAQFSTSEAACNGLTVDFFNESLAAGQFQWNFNYPDTSAVFASSDTNPTFIFPQSGIYNVFLRATRGSDGCFDTISLPVSVFTNQIVPNFSLAVTGCDEGSEFIDIRLSDLSVFDEPGYVLDEFEWRVIQGVDTTIYSGQNVVISIRKDLDVFVGMTVHASNGCIATFERFIPIEDIIPQTDFTYALVGCDASNGAILKLTDLSPSLNQYTLTDKSTWMVNGNTIEGSSVEVTIPVQESQVNITLISSFVGTCNVSKDSTIRLDVLLPIGDFEWNALGCPDFATTELSFSFIDTMALGLNPSSIEWVFQYNNQIISGQNASIIQALPKDSTILVTLTTTFENGCMHTISREITSGPFASLQFPDDTLILCPNQMVPLILNYNPEWDYTFNTTEGIDFTNPEMPVVFADTNRTYIITVSDGLCSVEGSIDVISLEGGVNIDIVGDTTTCNGQIQLEAFGGLGQGTYTWSNDPNFLVILGSGQSFVDTFAGNDQTYFAQFVGEQCSTEPASITIISQAPNVIPVYPTAICYGDTVTISLVNQNLLHTNTYIWDSSAHIISSITDAQIMVTLQEGQVGPIILHYTASNQYGCNYRDSFEISIGTNPIADFDFTLTTCGQYEVCFSTESPYSGFIKWNFGDPNSSDDSSLLDSICYQYSQSGTYTVILENLVSVCPFVPVQKEIVLNPQIEFIALPDTTACIGDTVTLNALVNIPNLMIAWTNSNGQVLSNEEQVSLEVKSDTTLVVSGVDAFGCTDSDTVSVRIFQFDIQTAIPDSFCYGQNTQISVATSQNLSFEWHPNECIASGGNTSSPTIIGLPDKIIKAIITDNTYGCIDSLEFSPQVTVPFDFNADIPEILCYDELLDVFLLIDQPQNYTYVWSPSEIIIEGQNTTRPSIAATEDGVLSVSVTSLVNGCIETREFAYMVNDDILPEVNAEPDLTIFEGEALTLFIVNPVEGDVYLWSNGQTGNNIIVAPSESTIYFVTVTDVNGCTGVDEVEVVVRQAQCDETDVYLPNAFSPNGDNNNDIFIVRSNFIDQMELIIYNRWGQEVFRTRDKNVGWDGTLNGKPLGSDTYAYYLRALCVNAEEYIAKGNVSLIR